MRRTRSGCCARAASGHPTVEPTIPFTKSRRRIAFPKLGSAAFGFLLRPSKQEFAASDMGRKWSVLRCKNSEPRAGEMGGLLDVFTIYSSPEKSLEQARLNSVMPGRGFRASCGYHSLGGP
jgi:hypothetical protein